MAADDARRLIADLGLEPHPEGGHFRRFHASAAEVECNGRRRPGMTAIHYLLQRGERSQWHRVDADEAWHWQQGDALALLQFDASTGSFFRIRLGQDEGMARSHIVPAGNWQSAMPLGDHALAICTVAPGFVWEGFELLDPDSALAKELRRAETLHP